jgi:hypothetical protein
MSTAYHPQSDGQTEVVNKVIQQYLRCFVHENPKTWGKFIHWAEWHYNTAVHTSTGISPYQVVFGKPPPSLPAYIVGSTHVEALDTTLASREEILQQLKSKLLKAQNTMKYFADKHRSPHPFKVGDYAFVRLRPYRQISVSGPRIQKLAKRYYGPFLIIRQIGEVAFELQLPDSSKIHPVFHVSQLKPHHGDVPSTIEIPPEALEDKTPVQLLAVINWRDNAGNPQVLIQWDGPNPEDATWEPYGEILQTFPNFHLEDKVSLDGKWNVMTQDELITNEEVPIDIQSTQGRPKRKTQQPKKYDGFDLTKKRGGKGKTK